MLGTTTTDQNNNVDDNAMPPRVALPSKSYLCTSCHMTFQDGQEQRLHMKQQWHVYNMKRRLVSLPPISQDAYDTLMRTATQSDPTFPPMRARGNVDSNNDEDVADDKQEQALSVYQCLFCDHDSASDDAGFAMNVDHMQTTHGFTIPEPARLIDLQSLVGYLATEVRTWNECLYCGAVKSSAAAIQSHMRDKDHCLLNLDREPELLDFWDDTQWFGASDVDGSAMRRNLESLQIVASSSTEEMYLPSGKTINSRHAALMSSKVARKRRTLASTQSRISLPVEEVSEAQNQSISDTSQQSSDRQMARRDDMSLLGIPEQQRKALILAEKKAQRTEAVARRAREWAYARAANSQEFDQLDTKMKMGRQNHKLMPR